MFSFLSKKKKFQAQCELSKVPLQRESSYIVTTAQVISSKKFWDNIMTEPDTMSYTEAHFKSADPTAKNIRTMIFKKYSTNDKPWVISDSQLHLFEVNEMEAKAAAEKWWDSEGTLVPEDYKSSLKVLGEQAFNEIQAYAIMEAGKSRVMSKAS